MCCIFTGERGSGGVAVWHRKREMVVEIYNDYIYIWLHVIWGSETTKCKNINSCNVLP